MGSIKRARYVIIGGRWFLIAGLVFYSLMTTTPFVSEHSEWDWSGWALGLIVDAAFIMALSAESTLAQMGIRELGHWPAAFRWFTGAASIFLNIWVSVEKESAVGVAVHLIAPVLVMLLAEVGPVYLAALARAEAQQRNVEFAEQVSAEAPLTDWEQSEPEDHPEFSAPTEPIVELAPADIEAHAKLSRAEANKIIEDGWRYKLHPNEVAAAAGRHPATVRRKFKELEQAHA